MAPSVTDNLFQNGQHCTFQFPSESMICPIIVERELELTDMICNSKEEKNPDRHLLQWQKEYKRGSTMEPNQASVLLKHILETFPDPIFLLDENGTYVEIAGGLERQLYDSPEYLKTYTLHDIVSKAEADRFLSVVKAAVKGKKLKTIEYCLTSSEMKFNPMDGPKGPQWYHGRVYPIVLPKETVGHVIWVAINITEKKEVEQERDRVIRELKQALEEIKTLRGILPICSNCKKIRDDKGYWNRIESYLETHSDAVFSHSICKECARELYPELDLDDDLF